ncbi:MAG: metallophosphoesterase [Deltaproteobacteria bacterium]|nr:metallophosphoesterase [Deltaproteobacteria bacterium]
MLTRRNFMKIALVSATTLSLGLQVGCDGNGESDDADPVEFTLISDAHLYDSRLGITGAAFEEYLATDPKLLCESEAILKSAVDSIKSSSAQFVLICGDMTKDGERDCHELMASYLAQLRAAGKMVYVVPGNHDVDNPEAYSYSGSTQTPVPNVTPEEFTDIYWDYGYSAAIARDPNSLSYVAEPTEGYWLLAMDSCIYKNNTSGKPNTAGAFSDQTLDWIRARLAEASQQNKIVLGLMHHGLVEHFTGQATLFPGFVINDWENLSQILAQDGLRYVFTGHFHATDCTERTWTDTGDQLYDIETGSPVSSPCAYRQVRIENGVMDIDTIRITSIDYDTGSATFQEYARDYAMQKGQNMFVGMFMSPPYNLTQAEAEGFTPTFMNALLAHYGGDESPDASTLSTIQTLLGSSDPTDIELGQFLSTLWTDLTPEDNSLNVPM